MNGGGEILLFPSAFIKEPDEPGCQFTGILQYTAKLRGVHLRLITSHLQAFLSIEELFYKSCALIDLPFAGCLDKSYQTHSFPDLLSIEKLSSMRCSQANITRWSNSLDSASPIWVVKFEIEKGDD